MNKLLYVFSSFVIGLFLGSINWYLLYRLYRNLIVFSNKGKLSKKDKVNLVLTALLKVSVLFAGLYIVIVVFKFNVLYLLLGLVISLICMAILVFRMNK
ncbi:MAG: hypothetical protein WCQ53_01755 [bacterium]